VCFNGEGEENWYDVNEREMNEKTYWMKKMKNDMKRNREK